MKSYLRATYRTPMVLLILVLLVIPFLTGKGAEAAPQYVIDCDGCHRMPPLDSNDGKRKPDSGAVKGNHETHSGTTASSCTVCHGPGVLSSTGHRDKSIQVNGNINTSPAGGSYTRSAGVFINQTTIPPLGTCSSVNCHFEATTAAWGSSKYQRPQDDPAACGACHGTPANSAPADGNHPGAAATGLKHAAYYGTGTGSCAKCHPDHAGEGAPFAHATSARPGGRALAVGFGADGGSYSKTANLNYPNYLPSQNPTRNGSCDGVYCHSNGAGQPGLTAPVWGTVGLDCAGCHGYDANSGAKAIATNQHGTHIANSAKVGRNIACQECHSSTIGSGNSIVVANHVDRNVNVKFDNSINRDSDAPAYNGQPTNAAAGSVKAPQSQVGSCANVYCHSVGNLDAAGNVVPAGGSSFLDIAWNGGAIGCDGCHGEAGKSHPVYASGAEGSATANNHVRHVEGKGYGCDFCHIGTTDDAALPPTTVKAGGLHLDRQENVGFKNFGGQSGSYDGSLGNKGCSATYCHSSGEATPVPALVSAKWGGKLDCRGCHGGDSQHDNPITTGRHGAHINAAKRAGAPTNLACAECHALTVSAFDNNTAITNQLRHVNTFREYSGVRAGKMASYYTQVTCGNTYCHSSGEASPVFRNMTGGKRWGDNKPIGCAGCHGYGAGSFTPVAGEPNYPSRAGAENSHQKHTVGANMADSTGCALCHRTTVDQGVKNRLKSYSSTHLNGVREVNFAPLGNMTGHYDAGKRCSNTYCHGSGTSIPWGSATPLLCNDCHKSDATLSGAHASHYEAATAATSYTALPGNLGGTTTSYRFECSSCHNGVHAKGPATGGNAAEVFFNYTAPGQKGDYSYGLVTANDGVLQWSNGTCSGTYCHSQGDAGKSEGKGTASITWSTPAKSLRCDGCHGGDISKPGTVITTGLHRTHIDPTVNGSLGTGNELKCAECHAKTVAFASNTTVTDKRRHVNKFRDYSGVMAGGSANYPQPGKTCSNFYCHGNGKPGTPVSQFRTLAAWDSGATLQCNGCHGQAASADPSFPTNPVLGSPNYLNTGTAGGNGSNSHKLHVQKMGITAANGCYVCHAKTMSKYAAQQFRPYSTAHLKGVADVSFGAMSTAGFKLMSSVAKVSYDKGTRSCSTVTCHSNGKGGYQSAKWGEASNCAMCHALNKLSRGHIFHVYTTAVNNPTFYDNYTANRSNSEVAPGRYNYGCANCHPLNNPNHMKGTVLIDLTPGTLGTVGRLRSLNGTAINVSAVPAGTSGSGTTVVGNQLFCDNVYCHSNGYSANLKYATTPDWFAGNFTGDRCANCHGNSPNTDPAAMPGSPSHTNLNWLGSGTVGGHFMGIHAKTITNKMYAGAPETFVGLLSPGSVEPASHGVSTSSTTVSCNTCHWETVQTSANFGSSQCNGCHTLPATRAYATIADKSKHVTGQVRVSFQPSVVKSKAQIRDVSFNDISGAGPWRRSGVYKSPTGYDYSKNSLGGTAGWSGGNCSTVVCHFNQPVRWDITPGSVTCENCHTSM